MSGRLELLPGRWRSKDGRVFEIRRMEQEIDGFMFFCPVSGFRWTHLGAFRAGFERHRYDLVALHDLPRETP